jgi:hypothetical protein
MQLLYEGLCRGSQYRCRVSKGTRAGRAFARPVGFAHPTDCKLICFARKRNLYVQLRQTGTTGKSLKTCPAHFAKIFCLTWRPNHPHNLPVSRRMRGVGHRHERAVRCDGRRWCARRTRLKRTAKSCGSGAAVLALSRRLRIDPSDRARYPADNGGKRAVLRGEHEVSRKAIAQGRPECSRCPVCSCAVLFAQIARETAGAASTRSSLRPLNERAGRLSSKPRTQCAARTRSRIQQESRHCERSEEP